jgi:phage FluMu protein gp41
LALHVIRHQVQSIGDINGPLSVKNLESLSMRDLMLIEEKSNALEAAIFAEGLAKTGRA